MCTLSSQKQAQMLEEANNNISVYQVCYINLEFLNFRCDGVGHIARDCSQSASEPSCYNCRKTGHLARDCPDERAERGGYGGNIGGSSSMCYNCNKIGHFSRDCMESR